MFPKTLNRPSPLNSHRPLKSGLSMVERGFGGPETNPNASITHSKTTIRSRVGQMVNTITKLSIKIGTSKLQVRGTLGPTATLTIPRKILIHINAFQPQKLARELFLLLLLIELTRFFKRA